MEDIVELLKTEAVDVAAEGHLGWGNAMLFAAEEIERLRKALKANHEFHIETAESALDYLSSNLGYMNTTALNITPGHANSCVCTAADGSPLMQCHECPR